MKDFYPIKSTSNRRNLETKNVKNLDQGVTKKLLEKYMPKDLYNIEIIRISEDQKKSA